MVSQRIVIGAVGDDSGVGVAARKLRDEGHEIVFVGGGQTPEQLARTAVAEDARRLVVDTDATGLERIREACARLDAADIVVEPAV